MKMDMQREKRSGLGDLFFFFFFATDSVGGRIRADWEAWLEVASKPSVGT